MSTVRCGLECRYQLGPNGAILTSLNLFSTRFNEVMTFLDKKKDTLRCSLSDAI